MRKGERNIFLGIALTIIALMFFNGVRQQQASTQDRTLPFYTTSTDQQNRQAMNVYRHYDCKSCHALWTVKDIMRTVPAPALDGIGSLRTRDWLYKYMTATKPQEILPSRLKAEFRMPSYATMPEEDMKTLVDYLASLKAQDWYLNDLRRSECRKLTGDSCDQFKVPAGKR